MQVFSSLTISRNAGRFVMYTLTPSSVLIYGKVNSLVSPFTFHRVPNSYHVSVCIGRDL